MKLSPIIARNVEHRINLCLDSRDRPILVTDEFISDTYGHWFDDSIVIHCADNAHQIEYPVTEFGVIQYPTIRLCRYLLDGKYIAYWGIVRVSNKRYIVARPRIEERPASAPPHPAATP